MSALLLVVVGPCPREGCGGALMLEAQEQGRPVHRCSLCARSPQEPQREPTAIERDGHYGYVREDGTVVMRRRQPSIAGMAI